MRTRIFPAGRRYFVVRKSAVLTISMCLAFLVCISEQRSSAQSSTKPVAQLPLVYLDTTWSAPTKGKIYTPHTANQLTNALANSSPGDTIVLDAGTTYKGNFHLAARANRKGKWTYIISSAMANLPEGTRVSPADTANMPTIVTTNSSPAFIVDDGADHYRLAGLEITSSSNQGCNPNNNPPINCFTYFLIGNGTTPTTLPDSIVVDRSYLHGSPTIDLQRAILANFSNFAVVDSYISEVHMTSAESQTVLAYWSPGPFKIVNNFLEAAGENIMFGGAGGASNPYVPSDIEIRNNYLYKPLSWAVSGAGGTLAPNPQWIAKNAFEMKSGQRVLFDGNVIQNVWAAAQSGFAILLTVRTSQSGDVAVVNDITITNNVLNNVVAGISALAEDDTCGADGGYPNCHNAGSQARWNISDNLMVFYDPNLPGGMRNVAIMLNGGKDRVNTNTPGTITDVVFQHNTSVSASSTPCWGSIYFSANGQTPPFPVPISNNVWILDNALCVQPSGDWGLRGTSGLTNYMGLPSAAPNDITQRFYGNVMWVAPGDTAFSYSTGNLATTSSFTYVDPSSSNYQLVSPYWITTSDGLETGIINSSLPIVPTNPPN